MKIQLIVASLMALFPHKSTSSPTRPSNSYNNDKIDPIDYNTALENLEKIPFIPKSIDHDNLESDASQIVCNLFPSWQHSDLQISRCTDGITNKLLKIKNIKSKKVVLVRCYGEGTSSIIDRDNELISMVTLSELGVAPDLYGRFVNGFCYGFVEGQVLSPEDIRSDRVAPAVARKMARWHKLQFPKKPNCKTMNGDGDDEPELWRIMANWMNLIPKEYSNPETQEKYMGNQELLSPLVLTREIDFLHRQLAHVKTSKIVFCHNDLLSANIICKKDPSSASSPASSPSDITADDISFIDYEYGSYSYNSFDIGNHFNEYAGFECDYTRFPSDQMQKEWIRNYLSELNGISLNEIGELEVENLFKDVQKFSLVSHFYWAIWGMVQAQLSDIDFDYMQYALIRFQEYYRLKNQVFEI